MLEFRKRILILHECIQQKDQINEDGDPTTTYKLATGTKALVSQLCVLFFSYVVREATVNFDKKALNMRHKTQNGFCGMEKITTEEVMDKLDIFQFRSGKIDEFGWWYLEIISADVGTQFTLT